MKMQKGFTLIELIVVIVILGILAATALPKFVDLKGEASLAAAKGYAGALSSANTINYAGCLATGNTAKMNVCTILSAATAKCSSIGPLMDPAIVFTVGATPPTTVQGTFYLATDTALTQAGVNCTTVMGDGGAGQSVTYTARATGA